MEYMLPRVKYIAMSFKFLNDVAPSTLLYVNRILIQNNIGQQQVKWDINTRQ